MASLGIHVTEGVGISRPNPLSAITSHPLGPVTIPPRIMTGTGGENHAEPGLPKPQLSGREDSNGAGQRLSRVRTRPTRSKGERRSIKMGRIYPATACAFCGHVCHPTLGGAAPTPYDSSLLFSEVCLPESRKRRKAVPDVPFDSVVRRLGPVGDAMTTETAAQVGRRQRTRR